MKKHAYGIIPLLCFAGPFSMSFDRKVYFIQYLPATLVAIAIIGLSYILWDIIVTRKGHWRFNTEFVGTFRLLHLPIGEWLFFLLIPYACLFLFEVVAAYWGTGTAHPELTWLQYVLGCVFIVFAVIWRKQGYTCLAMTSVAVFFLSSGVLTPGAMFASGYLLSFLFIFLAFLLINGLYTSLPTIFYNRNEIFGLRLGSIPLEDFFYNLSYIGLVLTVYLAMKDVLKL